MAISWTIVAVGFFGFLAGRYCRCRDAPVATPASLPTWETRMAISAVNLVDIVNAALERLQKLKGNH